MRFEEANKLIDKLLKAIEKNGVNDQLIPDLKKLREWALKEEDPLVTKVIRLSYEYIEENECFDISVAKDEDEEGNEFYLEPGSDEENFSYLLNLLVNNENEYNREEIRDYRTQLKEALY
ncbi:MAG: hypothetical protein KDC84_08270 [Crocinitomicaceae bacterium]|nr:hypothetical protein [Crocinitomicaceae bacterium]